MKRFGIRISDNMLRNVNGFLEIYNCPIARTGTQEYHGTELPEALLKDMNKDKIYIVHRRPEDVFDEDFMNSILHNPVLLEHSNEDVTIDNYKDYEKGSVTNVRKGVDPNLSLDKEYLDEE
jgi:hypothetical protein